MTLANTAELSIMTRHPEVIVGALSPEMSEKIPRTRVAVEREGEKVTVKIEAEDQTALRAALNSYIRWMNIAEETAKEAVRR